VVVVAVAVAVDTSELEMDSSIIGMVSARPFWTEIGWITRWKGTKVNEEATLVAVYSSVDDNECELSMCASSLEWFDRS